MDWFKVKTLHVLHEYNDLTPPQFEAWVKIMALTATLEKLPTQEQIIRLTDRRVLKSLENKLKTHRTSLESVLKKVLEDVEHVRTQRKKWREKYGRHKKLPGELPGEHPRELPDKEGEGEGEGEDIGDIHPLKETHYAKNNNSNKDKSERPTNRGTKVSESGEVQSFVAGVAKGMEAGV